MPKGQKGWDVCDITDLIWPLITTTECSCLEEKLLHAAYCAWKQPESFGLNKPRSNLKPAHIVTNIS